METTKPCKFQPGQSVEVLRTDFATPGMPAVWVAATVSGVSVMNADRGLWNVQLSVAGVPHVETVGPRGGGKRLRAA